MLEYRIEQVARSVTMHRRYLNGVAEPEIIEFVKQANDRYVHRPLSFYPNRYVTRPRTDGAVFMKNGYRAVDFYAVGGESYYHEPRDSWEIQDPSTLQDVARALYWSVINAANAD